MKAQKMLPCVYSKERFGVLLCLTCILTSSTFFLFNDMTSKEYTKDGLMENGKLNHFSHDAVMLNFDKFLNECHKIAKKQQIDVS